MSDVTIALDKDVAKVLRNLRNYTWYKNTKPTRLGLKSSVRSLSRFIEISEILALKEGFISLLKRMEKATMLLKHQLTQIISMRLTLNIGTNDNYGRIVPTKDFGHSELSNIAIKTSLEIADTCLCDIEDRIIHLLEKLTITREKIVQEIY